MRQSNRICSEKSAEVILNNHRLINVLRVEADECAHPCKVSQICLTTILARLLSESHDLPHGTTCGGLGVNMLGEGLQLDIARTQLIQHGDKIAETTAKAVKLPDNERVPWLERFEALSESRALRGRAGDAFVFEDFLASSLLQGRQLQGGVLLISGDTRVTIFHAIIM